MSIAPGSKGVTRQVAYMVAMEFNAIEYIGGREHVMFLDAHGKQLGNVIVTPDNRAELLAARQEFKDRGAVFAVSHMGAERYGKPGEFTMVQVINGVSDGQLYCLHTVPGYQEWAEVPDPVLEKWHEYWDE